MLTQRTYDVIRELVALVDISADLTYEAFLAFRFRLRLDVLLVVGVRHGLLIGKHSGLSHGTNEHAVGIKIEYNLQPSMT